MIQVQLHQVLLSCSELVLRVAGKDNLGLICLICCWCRKPIMPKREGEPSVFEFETTLTLTCGLEHTCQPTSSFYCPFLVSSQHDFPPIFLLLYKAFLQHIKSFRLLRSSRMTYTKSLCFTCRWQVILAVLCLLLNLMLKCDKTRKKKITPNLLQKASTERQYAENQRTERGWSSFLFTLSFPANWISQLKVTHLCFRMMLQAAKHCTFNYSKCEWKPVNEMKMLAAGRHIFLGEDFQPHLSFRTLWIEKGAIGTNCIVNKRQNFNTHLYFATTHTVKRVKLSAGTWWSCSPVPIQTCCPSWKF